MTAVVNAQTTYTTIANGNWNSASTWQGGNIPSSSIGATDIVNIRHIIAYNTGMNIAIDGTLRIEPTSGTTARLDIPTSINVENNSTGKVYIINGAFAQCRFDGCGNSGVFKMRVRLKNIGGYIEILNSYVEIAQDWTSESGGKRIFKNG
ncbi:MAG: hypothetical protein HC817_15540, partial [Saprospiraceae bacterium]|nr:hypothetical protein [Saprospiraceae bacterium]